MYEASTYFCMQAGGKTSDAVTGMSCLDIKINAVDQVCGVSGGWVGVGVGVCGLP